PGRERDTTTYKREHFDARYPIDIGRKIDFALPAAGTASEILRTLKKELPYLIRFETVTRNSRAGHSDLETTNVVLDLKAGLTPEAVLVQVIKQLPTGWHAT